MAKRIRVTVWNEFYHEQHKENVRKVYPDGIHNTIKAKLLEQGDYEITTATLDMPLHGLDDRVLENTDVLIWWGHAKHAAVSDEIAEKVRQRVLGGMGLIVLHSGHLSKPFKLLMGTSCQLKWRVSDDLERIWVVEPSHPIAENLPEYFELPQEEMYGERFEIPAPDELVFLSWFSGGEVFRSGCCYKRGLGKVFYFRPGHESYPTYYNENVARVLHNAVQWACPKSFTPPTLGEYPKITPEKTEW